MLEGRCGNCNRYLFGYDFSGQFNLVIKCKGCGKTNVFNFAKVIMNSPEEEVVTTSDYAFTGCFN